MDIFDDYNTRDEWIPLVDPSSSTKCSGMVDLLTKGDLFITAGLYNICIVARTDGGTSIKFDVDGGLVASIPKGRVTLFKTTREGRLFEFYSGNCPIESNILIYPKHIEWKETTNHNKKAEQSFSDILDMRLRMAEEEEPPQTHMYGPRVTTSNSSGGAVWIDNTYSSGGRDIPFSGPGSMSGTLRPFTLERPLDYDDDPANNQDDNFF